MTGETTNLVNGRPYQHECPLYFAFNSGDISDVRPWNERQQEPLTDAKYPFQKSGGQCVFFDFNRWTSRRLADI